MSSVGEFDGGAAAAGTGALAPELIIPVLSSAGAEARSPFGPRRGRPQDSGDGDVMVRALRKESAARDAPKAAMQAEAALPEGTGTGESPSSETTSAESGPPQPPEAPAGWAGMLIQVLAIAVVAAGITLVALKFSGLLAPAQVRVVTFDVLKYENSERAQAMKLMGQGGAGAVAPMLSYVSKRLDTAIRETAGPGTLVVLSQAVVQGQTRDITDQVLKELGLPTKVPTATALNAPAIGPSTIAAPVTADPRSPLSRLIESGSHTTNRSIVP